MVKIEDVCLVGDGAHARIKRHENGILYLTSKNFKDEGLDLSKTEYISEDDYKKHFCKKSNAVINIKKGDLVFSIIGSIGSPYVVREGDVFGLSSSVAILRPDQKKINNRYLYYWILGDIFQEYVKNIKSGVAQGFLSLGMVRKLPVVLYPIITQEKIADVLSTYDELIENNNRRIEILEKAAEEIYREWFIRMRFPGYEKTKYIKGIPEGWETVKLEDVCKLVRGISYSTKEIEKDEGIPMLTLKSINAYGGYNYGGLRFFDGKIADRHYLKKDDLIMAITDMTQDRRVIGQVCLIPETNYDELVFSADLILLDELKIEKDYMYALLRYGGLSEHIAMFSNGANVLHLNQRILNKIRITLASESLRRQYESKHKLIQKQIGILEIQNQNLIKQRDLLLPRLMNGTIKVK